MHRHHVIPKHAGGTDHPNNIVLLTIEEHAEAHRLLYEEHNRWQDHLAWQMLSGQISKEEGIRYAQKHADKSWMKTDAGRQLMRDAQARSIAAGRKKPWNRGLTKENSPVLLEASIRAKRHMKEKRINSIGDAMRGRSFTEAHKLKLSVRAKNRPKIVCEHCDKAVAPGMYSRWHGENCAAR